MERGEAGVYNIAEAGPQLDTGKARSKLGWSAELRLAELGVAASPALVIDRV